MKPSLEKLGEAQVEPVSIPQEIHGPDAIVVAIRAAEFEEELGRFFLETPEPETLEDFVKQFCSRFS